MLLTALLNMLNLKHFKYKAIMEGAIFYHEDFYKQIELVPEGNYFKTIRDISDVNDLHGYANDKEHGFYKILERGTINVKTESSNIDFEIVKKELIPFAFIFFTKVKTGYGRSLTVKENTFAFGFERVAIFFETTTKGTIKTIWLAQSSDLPKANNPINLLKALLILGSHFKLILIDWNEEVVIRINSEERIQQYLQEAFAFTFLSQ
jgi:hypothetical protein